MLRIYCVRLPFCSAAAEIADAQWFDRETVKHALLFAYKDKSEASPAVATAPTAKVKVPGPFAIAHHLLKAWVNGEASDLRLQ
jgi:NADH pyrophosphatase NudC (nudix superfamily)